MRTLTARNWLAVWRASWRYHAVSGLLACAACAAHAGPNLVVNGGFETGNFAGWLVSDSSLTVARSEMPHSGSFEADLGNRSLSTLQQTISTIAGTPYTVDLWIGRLGLLAGGDAFSLAVSFAGTTFVNLTAATLPLNSPYSEYSTTVVATAASSPLVITYIDQPSYILIDDVSVTSPVPEPSEALLMLSGLVVVCSLARRNRKAA